MSPIDHEIVRRKLEAMTRTLKELQPIAQLDKDAYVAADIWHRKGTERLLHELIETAIDINTHVLVQSGKTAPDSMYESFVRLGDATIIPRDLADTLAPSAGLRNRLVHEYERIDERLVHSAVQDARRDYPRYVAAISAFLDNA